MQAASESLAPGGGEANGGEGRRSETFMHGATHTYMSANGSLFARRSKSPVSGTYTRPGERTLGCFAIGMHSTDVVLPNRGFPVTQGGHCAPLGAPAEVSNAEVDWRVQCIQ